MSTPSDKTRRGQVSPATRDAERQESRADHEPDRMPTPDEEQMAEEQDVDENAAEHYRDMAERGAKAKGEGRLP